MIISCPNCNTSYNLPDDKVRAGAKLRCKVCSQVFTLVESNEGLVGAIIPPPQQPVSQPIQQEAPREVGKGNSNLSINLDGKKKKSSKMPYIILLLIVLLAAGGFYAWRYTTLLDPVKTMISDLLDGDGGGTDSEPQTNPMLELTANLGLRNLRQYVINNDKVGEILAVEGRVINESAEVREMIRLELQLYSASGQLLLSKSQLAGTQVSQFQLEVLDKEELEQALNNRLDQITNNSNIQPGESVPFMIVVYNPPAEATDVGVTITEARRPEAAPAS